MRTPLASFTAVVLVSASAAALAVTSGGAHFGGVSGGGGSAPPAPAAAPAPAPAVGGHWAGPAVSGGGMRGGAGGMHAGGSFGGVGRHGYAILGAAHSWNGASFAGGRVASSGNRVALLGSRASFHENLIAARGNGLVVGARPRSAATAVRTSAQQHRLLRRTKAGAGLPSNPNYQACVGGGPSGACPTISGGGAYLGSDCLKASVTPLGFATGEGCGGWITYGPGPWPSAVKSKPAAGRARL